MRMKAVGLAGVSNNFFLIYDFLWKEEPTLTIPKNLRECMVRKPSYCANYRNSNEDHSFIIWWLEVKVSYFST
jgi:hypothetical protein